MRRILDRLRSDGSTVVKLDSVVEKCVKTAHDVYGTVLDLVVEKNGIFVMHDIDTVVSQLVQTLETVCLTEEYARVIVASDERQKTATVSFYCEGVCNGIVMEFDLYTGIPEAVISDADADELLEEYIREKFKEAAEIRKRLGQNSAIRMKNGKKI